MIENRAIADEKRVRITQLIRNNQLILRHPLPRRLISAHYAFVWLPAMEHWLFFSVLIFRDYVSSGTTAALARKMLHYKRPILFSGSGNLAHGLSEQG
jgi:hypothetical protein